MGSHLTLDADPNECTHRTFGGTTRDPKFLNQTVILDVYAPFFFTMFRPRESIGTLAGTRTSSVGDIVRVPVEVSHGNSHDGKKRGAPRIKATVGGYPQFSLPGQSQKRVHL